MSGRRRAVFLDRDGVLTEVTTVSGVPHPLAPEEGLRLRPGVEQACHRLRQEGLLLVCVSNQPDIARGTVRAAAVASLNEQLAQRLGLHDVQVCPHDDGDGCACRKPLPGMLLRAAADLSIDLGHSVMVGDRWRDVAAGRGAGCRTIFVDNGYDERRPEDPDLTATSLASAVPDILRMTMGNATLPQPAVSALDAGNLGISVFADGATCSTIIELAANPMIKGFTTNPTLMRAAGVLDYEAFAHEVVAAVPEMPVSFEVFADDLEGMERQARRIAEWGDHVYVKVPVTNTRGESTVPVVRRLNSDGVKLNVTALFTVDQVRTVTAALTAVTPAFISVFAGRIADSGRDPVPIMVESLAVMAPHPHLQLIWASPREVLNVVQADEIGCHVITVTHDLLKKLSSLGKDLEQFSLETVRMFHGDAEAAGFVL